MSLRQMNYSAYTMSRPWKTFVRESQEVEEKPSKKEVHRLHIEGGNARIVYEEIIKQEYRVKQDVSKSQKNNVQGRMVVKLPAVNAQPKKTESSKKAPPKTSIHAILKAVEQKDLKYLLKHVTLENVNLTDEFGWTPLMSAAYCGHIEVIEFLLRLGANRKATDRSGYTAAQLALKKNYLNVVALLKRRTESISPKALPEAPKESSRVQMELPSSTRSGTEEVSKTSVKAKDNDDKQNEKPQKTTGFYCDICDATFYHATPKAHETSTLHIFNTKPKVTNAIYGISKHNKGYQMLLNTGWDEQAGLGPSGKGIKYPVKTYLKVDRMGLGQPIDTEPRVTHFKPGDTKAISNLKLSKQKTLKKSDREKLLSIEARKERALRIALS